MHPSPSTCRKEQSFRAAWQCQDISSLGRSGICLWDFPLTVVPSLTYLRFSSSFSLRYVNSHRKVAVVQKPFCLLMVTFACLQFNFILGGIFIAGHSRFSQALQITHTQCNSGQCHHNLFCLKWSCFSHHPCIFLTEWTCSLCYNPPRAWALAVVTVSVTKMLPCRLLLASLNVFRTKWIVIMFYKDLIF